jgi:hypothetical protein
MPGTSLLSDALSGLVDDLKSQCLAELCHRFHHVAVDRHAMPAELIPLVTQFTDVSTYFRNKLGATTSFSLERSNGLGFVNDQLLAYRIGAESGRHVAAGHERFRAGTARITVMQSPDTVIVRFTLGAEHFCRADAMGVDNLVFGSIECRIRHEAGTAGENSGHEHAERVVGHRLAHSLSAIVQ